MDNNHLISIVKDYEMLFNDRHPHYSNQQVRDNIWEEIGRKMNEPSNLCRERWTRLRDNHRKALNLRKTRTGKAALKLKPAKYAQELNFLTPYLQDDKPRRTYVSPVHVNCDIDEASTSDQKLDNFESSEMLEATSFMASSRNGDMKMPRYAASESENTAGYLQEYLPQTTASLNQSNPLMEFFVNMAKTVNTFPVQDQVVIKSQLFQMVNEVEMRLAFASHPPV